MSEENSKMDVDDTNKEEEVSKVDTSATTGNSFGLYGVRIDLSMCRIYITMVPFIYIYVDVESVQFSSFKVFFLEIRDFPTSKEIGFTYR